MASGVGPARVAATRWASAAVKALGVIVLTTMGYGALTTGAYGPAFSTTPAPKPYVPDASISRDRGKVTITGSVSGLFSDATFSGPNRADKTDRLRPKTDVMTIAKSFDQVWSELASTKLAPPDARAPETLVAALTRTTPGAPGGDKSVQVASIDPSKANSALKAIDKAAPGPAGPAPITATKELAYARENLPKTTVAPLHERIGSKQLRCLTEAVYFEARGESYRGQVAVAQVVMNRVKMSLYPNTICGVVFQNEHRRNACQFSFACDGIPETVTEPKAWAQAKQIAEKVVDGKLYLPEVGKASHYHATYVHPDWAPRMKRITRIGMHIFYKFRGT